MGAIVGGVLGGLAVVVVAIFAGISVFVRSRRQRQQNQSEMSENLQSQPVIKFSFFNRQKIVPQPISGAPSKELERFSTNMGEEVGFSGRLRDD
jgi:hypothetical protein